MNGHVEVPAHRIEDAVSEFDSEAQPLIRSASFLLETMRNTDHASQTWREMMESPPEENPASVVTLQLVFLSLVERVEKLRNSLRTMALPE